MSGSKLQDHIDEVMDEFDFEEVQQVMEFLDWKWVSAEEGVPRVGELRKQVRSLMEQCHQQALKNMADWNVGTGGFTVRYFYEHDYFDVDFSLAQWATEYLSKPQEPPF